MEIVWRYLSFTTENSQKGGCIKLKDFGKGTSAKISLIINTNYQEIDKRKKERE